MVVSFAVHQAFVFCLVLMLAPAVTKGRESIDSSTTIIVNNTSSEYHPNDEDMSAVIVDLSQPWQEGSLYNKNRAYCNIQSH